MIFDPYTDMKTIISENFILRMVTFDDAESLVGCYSDPLAALTFNDDNCDFGFYVINADGVRNMIRFWLEEYKNKVYVRLVIIPKRTGTPVGTIELFNRGAHGQYDDVGVLRLDIESAYETQAYIRELVSTVLFELADAFKLQSLLIYAPEIAISRIAALRSIGFRDTKAGELVGWTDWQFVTVTDFKAAYIDYYWKAFLKDTGRSADTAYFDCDHFETTEQGARFLLDMTLSGKKRATASSARSYEAQNIRYPIAGDLSIITDFNGRPECVVETTNVTVIPFRDVTFDICSREGEDDCLESWQRNHIKFFTEDGIETGYSFSGDMPVVFEDYQVVYSSPTTGGEHSAFAGERDVKSMDEALNTVKLFLCRANELLGDAIMSAYLCGSATYADFHVGYSDIDFFFVSSRELTLDDFGLFHKLYKEYSALNDGLFSVLEGEIVYYGALDYSESGAIYWGTSGDKYKNKMSLSGFGVKGLFKRGMLLMGRDIRYDITKPDSLNMLALARNMVETVREHANIVGESAKYIDWLLLLSQTMYYLALKDTTCKTRAAEWVLSYGVLAQYENEIRTALDVRAQNVEYTRKIGENVKNAIFALADIVLAKLG